MLAQVGARASSNSSSGMEENDAWRVFVSPTQSDATHDASPWGQPKRPEQLRISPGVSIRHHALVSTAPSQTESPNPFVTGTPEHHQDTDSPKHDFRHMGSHLDQQMASASGPSVSYTISTSPRSDGTASYYSAQSRLARDVEVVEHSLGDDDSARRFDGRTESSLGNAGDSPPKAGLGPPGETDFAYDEISGDTDSETDIIDQRVADLRKAALNLVSRDAETPWGSRGKGNFGTTAQSSQCYTVDSNTSSGGTSQDVTHETGWDAFAEPPSESLPKYPSESPPEYHAQPLPESPQDVPSESPSESLPIYPTNFPAESPADVAQENLRLAGHATESPQEISPECPAERPAAFPCESPAKAAPEIATFAQTVAKAVPETVTFAKPDAETAARIVTDRPVEAVAQAGQKQPPTKETPRKESDNIWFKYLFSDTNTEELHNEVREKGAKEAAQALQQEAEKDGLGKASGSDWGHNMSTAATRGQMSIGATESGDDLTSASAASASRIAAIGSPVATQTAGTVLDGWEGTGGPPYAAPSMQCSSSSVTTLAPVVQEDSHDSGSAGPGPSESITDSAQTDVPSSFSSKAVEPAQSVVEQAGAKEAFRFARPKLFVGKLSESVRAERPIVPVKPIAMTKRKRGRSKKKAHDGRANIRSIPVYRDDPIEDFQDSSPPKRTRMRARAEPSLFGALDTEQGDIQ
ncbi:hypothetical protein GE09DRAFT_1227117 [Coniochaeta sp. 2T2.1]|nr:hypothetical protein GE09DRAFT_1227117 [Coniochaeta sp. 2T2.1]